MIFISRIGFGTNTHCLDSYPLEVPFAIAFDRAQVICHARFMNPFWYGVSFLLYSSELSLLLLLLLKLQIFSSSC